MISKKYYPFLDGFRAIAIMMVVLHHVRRNFNLDHLISGDSPVLKWIYFKAWNHGIDLTGVYLWMQERIINVKGVLGVEMFFVISGFLITRILLKNSGQSSVVRFYLHRFLKIVPSYWCLVLSALVIFACFNPQPFHETLVTIARYMFFLQNYFPRNPYLDHTWTMVIIEQFYLFCPLIILLVYSLVPSMPRRRAILIALCLLLIVVTPAIRIYCINNGEGQSLLAWPWQAPNPHRTTLYNLDSIAFGCLMALVEPWWQEWKINKGWGWMFWFSGTITYVYLFCMLDWSYFWGAWYLYSLGYLAFGALIVAAYHGVSVFARFESLQWLGRHSYGIYLWHFLLLVLWKTWLGKVSLLLLIPTYLTAAIGLGVLSSMTIERYFLSLRERVLPK